MAVFYGSYLLQLEMVLHWNPLFVKAPLRLEQLLFLFWDAAPCVHPRRFKISFIFPDCPQKLDEKQLLTFTGQVAA